MPDSPHLDVLLAFAHHSEVELIGTDGRFSQRLHVGAYDSQNLYTPWEIEFEDGRRLSSGVMGPDIQRVGRDFAEAGHEERGELATVMVHGAGDHNADAFATADPLILAKLPRHVVEGGNPMTLDEAVALLGLFLRVREDFTLDLGKGYRYSTGRSGFYFVLMRDLTPSGWRWFSGCVAHSHHAHDDRLILRSATERRKESHH